MKLFTTTKLLTQQQTLMKHVSSLKNIVLLSSLIMYGIEEVSNMWYYILEKNICMYITPDLSDANKWLEMNNKSIIKIWRRNANDIIIEVK